LSAGEWLYKSFLPALQGNIVILLAGRPGGLAERLDALRERNPRLLVHHTEVEALSVEETEEYLMAIAQVEGKQGDGDSAARLWSYNEKYSEVIHYLTGGRPILLALVADMVAHDWPLPPTFDLAPKELEKQSPRTWWPEIEGALALRIQDSAWPIGPTLRAMAWLRKGATPELLARVMELRARDGEWDVYTASGYLEQVSQLALVKARPGTRRVFLHDEMYALLEEHTLKKTAEDERERIYGAIRKYYREQTEDLEQRIEQFPPVYSSIRARLRQAYAEEMHYRLYHSPPLGYAMYFWLAEEALGGRDPETDMLLRAEFLRTLGMLKENDYHVGHIPREAEMDAAVRWGMRALFLQGNPDKALDIFDLVQRRWGKDAGKLRLPWAHLQLHQAVAQIQRAAGDDWAQARKLLDSVERTAEQLLAAPPDSPVVKGYRWQAKIVKSLSLNFRGYLDRQEGRYLEAVKHYQQSAMLQRRLGMAALIPTLTNLSYVMALTGEAHHARLMAEEAERLARRSGKEHMLAMTLNVRALVEGHDDHHKAALRYTDQALDVASRLPSPRVRGLIHLTRARAHRYLWNALGDNERQREPHFFPDALKEANQAVKLLRHSPTDRVDALLERGCVYRDLARRYHELGKRDETKEFAGRSKDDLERAAVLAGAIGLPRQQASAWTNLGWLLYYLGRKDGMEETLDKAYAPFPADYIFPTKGPLPPMAEKRRKREAMLPFWSTLGKVEMLKGYVSLDQALSSNGRGNPQDGLAQAAEHITLSLAYDELVAESYFDLRKAEEQLHKRILHDSLSIRALHRCAEQVAEEHELEQPTRFQQFLNRMFGPADLWS